MDKSSKDRELINAFLDTRSFDDEDRAWVMKACETDPSARAYWVERATGRLV